MYLDIKKMIKNYNVDLLKDKKACEYLEMYLHRNNGVFVDTSLYSTKKEANEKNIFDKL